MCTFRGIVGHSLMLLDAVRMQLYQKAINEIVKKGDIVCDIGTGSGIMAFFAVQAGAKKVYAIEQDGSILEEAKRMAQLNGLDKNIIFIKGRSNKVKLPERVDVVISELIGNFGIDEQIIRFYADANDRFLKPCGKILPLWLKLYLVPVQFDRFWNENVGIWNKDFYGLDFSPVKELLTGDKYIVDCAKNIVPMAKPALIFSIDLYKINNSPLIFNADFTVNNSGKAHGLVGYFNVGLTKDITLSTAPEEKLTHWKQSFFPFPEPVFVEEGDKICCQLKVVRNIFWNWATDIMRNGKKIEAFNQSNLIIDKQELISARSDFKPSLNQDAKIFSRVLSLCDSDKNIEEIATAIFKEYPEQFDNFDAAAKKVRKVIQGMV